VEFQELTYLNVFIYKYLDIDTKILDEPEYLQLIPNYKKHLPEHIDK